MAVKLNANVQVEGQVAASIGGAYEPQEVYFSVDGDDVLISCQKHPGKIKLPYDDLYSVMNTLKEVRNRKSQLEDQRKPLTKKRLPSRFTEEDDEDEDE